jgi:CO/xanthine dehydrogenase FAD-binding subunit
MLHEFDMFIPRTLEEALQFLTEKAPEIAPVAGGTNMTVDLRSGRRTPKYVLSVDKLLELKGIQRENGHVVMGSGVTLSEIYKSPIIAVHAPAFKEAAYLFANPIIRNRATVGGNLVDASPASDSAPPLLALGAEVELSSTLGRRRLPLDKFFLSVRKTQLRPDELLTSIRWEVPPSKSAMAYYKLGLRKADAISIVSVSVLLVGNADGYCQDVRIALGSVAPRPIRAYQAEEFLRNKPVTPKNLEEAGRLAAEETSPIGDLRASGDYRRRMVAVLVRRCLDQAGRQIWKKEE